MQHTLTGLKTFTLQPKYTNRWFLRIAIKASVENWTYYKLESIRYGLYAFQNLDRLKWEMLKDGKHTEMRTVIKITMKPEQKLPMQ